MNRFAAISASELATVLGVFGTILGGFYAFSYKQMKESRLERHTERADFMRALDKNAKAANRMATATERSADEAKERNGHLAEMIAKSSEDSKVMVDAALVKIVDNVAKVVKESKK